MLVPEHLDFDVARVDDELLDEHAIVAERGLGLRSCPRKTLADLTGRMGDAHALAAAAGGGLDHHRVADRLGDIDRLLLVVDDAEMAWHGRHFRGGRSLLAFDLVAHGGDRLGIGTDENDAGSGERRGKGFALGQKSVARMHRLGAALPAGSHDLVDDEVAFSGRRRPNGIAVSAICTCRASRSASE